MPLNILLYYNHNHPFDGIFLLLGIGLLIGACWLGMIILGGIAKLIIWFKENPIAIIVVIVIIIVSIYLSTKEEPKPDYRKYYQDYYNKNR